jgi:sporulation protein YlmC with PRC-barrel domain
MPIRGAHGLIGKQVVDSEGVEMGYVATEDERFLTIAEGPVGKLRLGRRYVANASDRIVLRGASRDLFANLNVIDSQGEFIGVVKDTIEAEDVLDSLIVEDEGGTMVDVLLEDIRSIDEWIELDIGTDALYDKQQN